MNQTIAKSALISRTSDDSQARLDTISSLAADLMQRARARGVDQAEVALNEGRGLNVGVRMGDVETVEFTRDRGLSLTVYFSSDEGRRKGSASSADLSPASIEATLDQACAIARYTQPDPYSGLGDADRMATHFPDLDLWHPWALDADAAVEMGIACEAAGREADSRIGNSEGASVSTGESVQVYANTHGFVGAERGTHHSISCSLIAGTGEAMQRDYWYTTALSPVDLESPEAVGRHAAERAVRRLDPRTPPTGKFPVLFASDMARSLVGHLLGAISGGAQYREASFLLGAAGEQIFPNWFSLNERPHQPRGLRSANFDADGIATNDSDLVHDGVLSRYLLGSYSARKLGLQSTGNAGGAHNLSASVGTSDTATLLRGMQRGLYVTELMGQGVNPVTGDYSRGAAGFWVENGELAYPVDEATIAGNLRQVFLGLEAIGSEIDLRSHIRIGPTLIGSMMVAGSGG